MLDRVWSCNRSKGDSEVRFACFDDDDFTIAFDPISGDTHLIGYLSYLVFSTLSERERTVPDLLGYFIAQFPDEDSSEIEASLRVSLEELSRCRLVVSALH